MPVQACLDRRVRLAPSSKGLQCGFSHGSCDPLPGRMGSHALPVLAAGPPGGRGTNDETAGALPASECPSHRDVKIFAFFVQKLGRVDELTC